MTLTGSKTDSCKGLNSGLSHSSKLVPVSSYGAAALAVGFFFVTCYVIFKDVFDGAPITPDHVMSMAVLIGTFASGHLLWGQLQQWRVLPAIGLTILFACGTIYCVTASGGRGAAVQNTKAEEAHKLNDDRERVKEDLRLAKQRLEDALQAETAECATGDGTRCKGWRRTREERETHANVLEASLRLMAPETVENPELRHAAKVFAAFPGVTATEQAIFGFLVLYWPFLKAVFCEIATLVFASIGFRHAPTQDRSATVEPSQSHPSVSVSVPQSQVSKPEALQDLLSLIHGTGTVPSQDALRLRWNRPKSTVSRWLIEWEASGRISRSQQGKYKSVIARSCTVLRVMK